MTVGMDMETVRMAKSQLGKNQSEPQDYLAMNKYLFLTEFEGRPVCYGTNFFSIDLCMPAGHKSKGRKNKYSPGTRNMYSLAKTMQVKNQEGILFLQILYFRKRGMKVNILMPRILLLWQTVR